MSEVATPAPKVVVMQVAMHMLRPVAPQPPPLRVLLSVQRRGPQLIRKTERAHPPRCLALLPARLLSTLSGPPRLAPPLALLPSLPSLPPPLEPLLAPR